MAEIKKLFNSIKSYSIQVRIFIYAALIIEVGFFISAIQILFFGLGYTNMTNTMPWAAWIVGDLGLIVLGGGAFFTGFILYIFRVDELKPIINSAVLIGLLCYVFTPVFIIFDLGQPLRMIFCFMYPNWGDNLMPLSMMTEVVFCVSIYLMILIIEFIPTALKHRLLHKNPLLHAAGHYMHKLMWIMAAVGTFLSFFHQGSLGGLFGVLYAKPGWFRPHLFFLAVTAALAAGPSFTVLVTWIAERTAGLKSIPEKTYQTLARISGAAFIVFFLFRIWDIYRLWTYYVPLADRRFIDLWGGSYGIWLLVLELALFMAPLILLNVRRFREREKFMIAGTAFGVAGMIINKLSLTLHGSSMPNFPWKDFISYAPSVQAVSYTHLRAHET